MFTPHDAAHHETNGVLAEQVPAAGAEVPTDNNSPKTAQAAAYEALEKSSGLDDIIVEDTGDEGSEMAGSETETRAVPLHTYTPETPQEPEIGDAGSGNIPPEVPPTGGSEGGFDDDSGNDAANEPSAPVVSDQVLDKPSAGEEATEFVTIPREEYECTQARVEELDGRVTELEKALGALLVKLDQNPETAIQAPSTTETSPEPHKEAPETPEPVIGRETPLVILPLREEDEVAKQLAESDLEVAANLANTFEQVSHSMAALGTHELFERANETETTKGGWRRSRGKDEKQLSRTVNTPDGKEHTYTVSYQKPKPETEIPTATSFAATTKDPLFPNGFVQVGVNMEDGAVKLAWNLQPSGNGTPTKSLLSGLDKEDTERIKSFVTMASAGRHAPRADSGVIEITQKGENLVLRRTFHAYNPHGGDVPPPVRGTEVLTFVPSTQRFTHTSLEGKHRVFKFNVTDHIPATDVQKLLEILPHMVPGEKHY